MRETKVVYQKNTLGIFCALKKKFMNLQIILLISIQLTHSLTSLMDKSREIIKKWRHISKNIQILYNKNT